MYFLTHLSSAGSNLKTWHLGIHQTVCIIDWNDDAYLLEEHSSHSHSFSLGFLFYIKINLCIWIYWCGRFERFVSASSHTIWNIVLLSKFLVYEYFISNIHLSKSSRNVRLLNYLLHYYWDTTDWKYMTLLLKCLWLWPWWQVMLLLSYSA